MFIITECIVLACLLINPHLSSYYVTYETLSTFNFTIYLCTRTGNTIGAIAGILGPIVVAWCTETWPEHGEGWRVAFFLTFFLSCGSLVLWFAVVKAEIMPALNNPHSE